MMKEKPTDQKGQIYLLMGFLGSGKTTFIRNLLQNTQNQKYAVIQNQFASGEMGIEQPLIMDESGVPFQSYLELPNGCICCSAKNDLIASIEYILNNTDVKKVIVETNGLADPSESIKQFWFDQEMNINAQLHSVISIFSVPKFSNLKDSDLFQKQIVFANKALITFVDKSTQNQIFEFQSYIMQKNQECKVQRNDNFDIVQFLQTSTLFDLKSLNLIDLTPPSGYLPINKTQISENRLKLEHQHSCSGNCPHEMNKHQSCIKIANEQRKSEIRQKKHNHQGIRSIFLKGKCIFESKSDIQHNVGMLLWQSGLKVLRIKGAYCLEKCNTVYELQGVDEIFEVKETKTEKDKYQGQTKILVIIQNTPQQAQITIPSHDHLKLDEQLMEKKLKNYLGIMC